MAGRPWSAPPPTLTSPPDAAPNPQPHYAISVWKFRDLEQRMIRLIYGEPELSKVPQGERLGRALHNFRRSSDREASARRSRSHGSRSGSLWLDDRVSSHPDRRL
jgi:hypothetical protein